MEELLTNLESKDFKTVEETVEKLNRLAIKGEVNLEEVANNYLRIDELSKLKDNQKELVKFGIVKFFDMNYERLEEKEQIIDFIQRETKSPSLKTRRRAKASKLRKYFKY